MSILLSVLLSTPAITLKDATDLATAAVGRCQARGQAVAASVVDAQGVPIVVLRGDGLAKPPFPASLKAATAVAFGATGEVMEQRQKTDPGFAAEIASRRDIYNPDGGSLPLFRDGQIVGGVAVAYTSHEMAHICATEALKSFPKLNQMPK